MTLKQAAELGQLAKAKGYTSRALQGKVQFLIMTPNKNGTYNIEKEVTGYVTYEEAKQIMGGE